jgi:hypothetical protein
MVGYMHVLRGLPDPGRHWTAFRDVGRDGGVYA